eukprot:3259120-Rhodomonas_salina.1
MLPARRGAVLRTQHHWLREHTRVAGPKLELELRGGGVRSAGARARWGCPGTFSLRFPSSSASRPR